MTLTRRNLMLFATSASICAAFPAAAAQYLGGPAFGSSWRAVLPKANETFSAQRAVTSIIEEVDMLMSPWRKESEISRFNCVRDANWTDLSHQVCTVLAECKIVSELTDGAFEPSIGPLVNRYGYGPIKGKMEKFSDLELRQGSAKKKSHHLTIDLCGIAKGYALDRMAAALDELEHEDYLIELGGEVRTGGRHPSGRDWSVGIERPGRKLAFQRIITPGKMALATSGIFQNGYRNNSILINHLIDPSRSKPVDNDLASVSVLAPTAMRADALATALMVMGPEMGANLANQQGIRALFLINRGQTFQEIITGDFAGHILA